MGDNSHSAFGYHEGPERSLAGWKRLAPEILQTVELCTEEPVSSDNPASGIGHESESTR